MSSPHKPERPCSVLGCAAVPTRPYLPGPRCERHGTPPPAPPAGTTLDERLRALGRAPRALTSDRLRRASEPAVRPGRTVTSHAAARRALPRSGTQRRLVLDALYEAFLAGSVGATDVQLQRHLNLSGNTVRPRRGELVDLWLVEDSGRKRVHHGAEHIVWRVTRDALAALGWRPDAELRQQQRPSSALDDVPDIEVRAWWGE